MNDALGGIDSVSYRGDGLYNPCGRVSDKEGRNKGTPQREASQP